MRTAWLQSARGDNLDQATPQVACHGELVTASTVSTAAMEVEAKFEILLGVTSSFHSG